MTEVAAESWCSAQANCSGFTALSQGGANTVKKIYFKCLLRQMFFWSTDEFIIGALYCSYC